MNKMTVAAVKAGAISLLRLASEGCSMNRCCVAQTAAVQMNLKAAKAAGSPVE